MTDQNTPRISHRVTKDTRSTSKKNGSGSKHHSKKEKGLYELSIFIAAIVTGTASSIISKVLYELKGIGSDGRLQTFDKPLAQTLAMFLAMTLGLPMHWIVHFFKIPFPGYDHPILPINDGENDFPSTAEERERLLIAPNILNQDVETSDEDISSETTRIPAKTYLILIIPSIFDLAATTLCVIGLLYLDVSVYQMLRGSSIIYVALLRQSVLKEHLYKFQWVGVFYNALSVVLVGASALLDASLKRTSDPTSLSSEQAFVGVLFMLAGTLVQALQFVFEEKVMVQDEIKVPPLLLFGMEGVWGSLLCLVLLFPLTYVLPGHDHGRYEDHWNTWAMLVNTPTLQRFMSLYMLVIFGYNLFAVLVTFSLSSIWHSILDNFRPMTVWITDLCIFYATHGGFGEPWTCNSWIELLGMVVLIYGTAIYNAPDVGSFRLDGSWYALGLNFTYEYEEIRAHRIFSMGSYPSLSRFLSSSSLTFSRRQASLRQTNSGLPSTDPRTLFPEHSF